MGTLCDAFDPKRNALNAIRLGLALLVVVWHSFPLTGRAPGFEPGRQLLANISVDGFFAISGFLITSSWLRRPDWRSFVWARFLRLMPGFWLALIVTALLIAPTTTFLAAGRLPDQYWSEAIHHVMRNAALKVNQYDIAGTPDRVPYPHVWNGSAWTLFWEALCYVGVLLVGLVGLLKRRWAVTTAFVLALAALTAVTAGLVDNSWIRNGARFGTMFLAGAVIHQFQHKLQVRRSWVIVAVVLLVASAFLPNYRLLAALPVAYLLIALGALGTTTRLRFSNDLSYGAYIFAFPLQQMLASAGVWRAGPAVFMLASIAITLPVAAASWFLVEKPALRLKRRDRQTVQEVAAFGSATSS